MNPGMCAMKLKFTPHTLSANRENGLRTCVVLFYGSLDKLYFSCFSPEIHISKLRYINARSHIRSIGDIKEPGGLIDVVLEPEIR